MDLLASRLARDGKIKSKSKKGVKRLSKHDTKENKKKIVSKVDYVTVEEHSKKEKDFSKPNKISSKKKKLIKDALLKKQDSQVENLAKLNTKTKVSKLKKSIKGDSKSFNKNIDNKVIKSLKQLKTCISKSDASAKQQDITAKKRKAPVLVKEDINSSKVIKKIKLQPNKPVRTKKNTVNIKRNDGVSKKLIKNKLQPKKSVVESIDAPLTKKEINNLKKLKAKSQLTKSVLVENNKAIVKAKKGITVSNKVKIKPTKPIVENNQEIKNILKAKKGTTAASSKVNIKPTKPVVENNQEIKNIKSKKRKELERDEQKSEPSLKKKEVINFVKALIKVTEIGKEEKKNLFDSEKPPILLNINCFKIPKTPLHQHRITLPHSLINATDDIAIFVKDLKRGRRRDPEDTIRHYKDIFEQHEITRIKTIIPFNQVKTEYSQYEMKRRLFGSYDYFLADGRISGHIAHLLGKHFREKRKLPTSVHMDKKNLKKEIDAALLKSSLQVHGNGDTSIIQIGTCAMKVEHIADNILAVIEDLSKNFPGGWANIRSLRIKTPLSLAIPIYVSLKNKNEVEVPVVMPKRPKAYKEVEGELSTFTSNMKVYVSPDGTVRTEKVGDDSDEETEEDVEEVDTKEGKVDNINKNAVNQVKDEEDDDDDDDNESDDDDDDDEDSED